MGEKDSAIRELEATITQKEQETAAAVARISQVAAELAQARQQMRQGSNNSRAEKADLARQIQEAQSQNQTLQAEIGRQKLELERVLGTVERDAEIKRREISDLQGQLAEVQGKAAKVAGLEEDIRLLNEQLANMRSVQQNLEDTLRAREAYIAQLKENYAMLHEENRNLRTTLKSARNRAVVPTPVPALPPVVPQGPVMQVRAKEPTVTYSTVTQVAAPACPTPQDIAYLGTETAAKKCCECQKFIDKANALIRKGARRGSKDALSIQLDGLELGKDTACAECNHYKQEAKAYGRVRRGGSRATKGAKFKKQSRKIVPLK